MPIAINTDFEDVKKDSIELEIERIKTGKKLEFSFRKKYKNNKISDALEGNRDFISSKRDNSLEEIELKDIDFDSRSFEFEEDNETEGESETIFFNTKNIERKEKKINAELKEDKIIKRIVNIEENKTEEREKNKKVIDTSLKSKEIEEKNKKVIDISLKSKEIKEKNKKVIDTSLKSKEKNKKVIDVYNSINYLVNNKRKERYLGEIKVLPIEKDIMGGYFTPDPIKLQNNLEFSTFSRKAEYSSYSYLNRIGSLRQYMNTSPQVLTVNTEYFVEDDFFTLKKIQEIENKFKSLVFPFRVQDSKDAKSKVINYSNPPIIQIDLGESSTIFDTEKLYVVTSVEINKDHERFRFNAELTNFEDKDYLTGDTLGFKVTLTIAEIDYNYFYSA